MKQRGFGVLDLVIYGGMAVAAVTAFHLFEQKYYVEPAIEAGATKQRVEDQKVVDGLKINLAAAQKQSTDALADVAACVAASATQSDQVKRWKAEADRRAAETAKAKAEGAAASSAARTAVARYQEIAARPPVKDETCEQKLKKTDDLLRDAARARAAAKAGK